MNEFEEKYEHEAADAQTQPINPRPESEFEPVADAAGGAADRVLKMIGRIKTSVGLVTHWECGSCLNSGWKNVFRFDGVGRRFQGVAKCYDCKYWENRKNGK